MCFIVYVGGNGHKSVRVRCLLTPPFFSFQRFRAGRLPARYS